jgi:membrane-associated phospholipid phosphatase
MNATWPALTPGSWRLWLVPLLVAALLPLVAWQGNVPLFLALNQAAARLPDVLWSDITVLGDTLVAFCVLLLFVRRRPELAMAVLLAALPATLLSHGIKDLADARRPFAMLGDAVHVVGPYLKSGSFPSGHTTTAFVLASVLTLGLRAPLHVAGVVLLASLAGISRVAVGAHWPADVLGGMLCGWASGVFGVWLARRWRPEDKPSVLLGVRLALIACCLILLFGHESGYPLARPWEQAIALAILTAHLLPGWRLPDPTQR